MSKKQRKYKQVYKFCSIWFRWKKNENVHPKFPKHAKTILNSTELSDPVADKVRRENAEVPSFAANKILIDSKLFFQLSPT